MSHRKLLAASIIAGLCFTGTLHAQDAAQTGSATQSSTDQGRADKTKAKELGTVTVVGIRDSEAESLQLKQASDSHVEIVTAEDVGKLPAKNVADTLQRLPGVNISSSSAHEGGFDESDRVSLRGTNPDLTQTLVNGHTVGTGDWFVLSQTQTVGRSVSYSLLPSEIVNQVVVHKTSEAKLVEGGSAGSVDIITRKPLEFAKQVTGQASIGGVYSDLPSNTKPQFDGLFNWKNDSNTFGAMVQAFYEERSLQRDGQEVVGGYAPFTSGGRTLYYPEEIGAVLFTQKRKREGGAVDLEWKATDNLTLDLNGFYSKLKADNYNRNYMTWVGHALANGATLTPNAINGNVITSGTVTGGTDASGVYDMISRPGASSSSQYWTLDADWRVTDHLSFKGQAGTTLGRGNSPTQDVLELGTQRGADINWNMRGLGKPINWSLGGDNSSPNAIVPTAGWIFGENGIHAKDKENWFSGAGELDFDEGALASLEFGVRYADHTRENLNSIAQGPTGDWTNLANYPTSWSNYPGGFGSDVGGTFPRNIWYYTPGQLADFDAQFANRDPVARFYFNDIYKVNEKDGAAYLQANFSGDRWSGNVGARYVSTRENISYSSTAPAANVSSSVGPITGSAFGDYYWNTYKHTYSKLLPSVNLKFELSEDVLARFAASQTLTRPDYSSLAGFVSLDDLTHTGSGGNPQLKPLISTNFDASLEWYFAPRGLVSVGVYEMSLNDYVGFGNEDRVYKDMQASQAAGHDVFNTYSVTVPHNVDGNVKGVELNYIQPIGDNFGVQANYTFASSHADNDQPLQGTSKNTFNVSGYFENKLFNARVSYTYRSSFYDGVSHTDNYYQSGIGNLALSLGYNVNDWMAITFDAMNLNNPTLKYYVKSDTYGKQPYAFYVNGRQYYLNLRFKF
ncbi:TonB-dependent receptor [Fulvimonas soli]|jgi:iron complex outermembrane receptor protein|uniref:Iron complex outermembrane receptor protein n=1 Tax=Fulvimonas soli TaxID=155197 RepID=A0A316HKT5_9GAMM|nr:TonB-dependent receptor [Fulvimonas soli]PWK81837.1 iron complex outermembrane receptor protein [Fulvimonas soli]TNY25985.1 TonB-dependent receptor [Fulvimonas soli]